MQAHHLIEKRFANQLNLDYKKMNAIALTKEEHQKFTNAWRKLIPYGTGTKSADIEKILKSAEMIYKDYPELLQAIQKELGVKWWKRYIKLLSTQVHKD